MAASALREAGRTRRARREGGAGDEVEGARVPASRASDERVRDTPARIVLMDGTAVAIASFRLDVITPAENFFRERSREKHDVSTRIIIIMPTGTLRRAARAPCFDPTGRGSCRRARRARCRSDAASAGPSPRFA
jgi:hypothetical protein